MSGLVSKDRTSYSLKLMNPASKTLIMDESKLIRSTIRTKRVSPVFLSRLVVTQYEFFFFLRFIRARKLGMVWYGMSIIPALGRLR